MGKRRQYKYKYIIFSFMGLQVTHKYGSSLKDVYEHFLQSPFARYLGYGWYDYTVRFYTNKKISFMSRNLEEVEEHYNEYIIPLDDEIERKRYANLFVCLLKGHHDNQTG